MNIRQASGDVREEIRIERVRIDTADEPDPRTGHVIHIRRRGVIARAGRGEEVEINPVIGEARVSALLRLLLMQEMRAEDR